MSGFSQSRQRPLLPALQPQTSVPTQNFLPGNIFPRRSRTCTAIACEGCRKRKTRCNGSRPRCMSCSRAGSECTYASPTNGIELQRQFRRLQAEKTAYQMLIDTLRSRDLREANLILDLLRQNTSVDDVLRQIKHGDMLCELSTVPKTSIVTMSINPPQLLELSPLGQLKTVLR
ncbi:Nitrogen assimilation transcription factor nirA [Fusarium oxysporum f. sp. raphani]|uniref:Nitrogen assimilation transcription factor nirA n=1 Tax=Fusarium oxysporum f. sp. raphani TaxID=96318 RepID=A0A8J5TP34_FUSOX|nr:Nitrogen assimilation transcription factor nirA [Fusarium oxysporum f. sp. raphani]